MGRFRHRIAILVSLAALALVMVTTVTLVLGRLNEAQLSGIETRYVPLLELNRDLKTLSVQIPRALEDAASAADEAKLKEADGFEAALQRGLSAGARTIIDNGGEPVAIAAELRRYYSNAREVSAAIAAGVAPAQLGAKIETMRTAQLDFAAHLDLATSPDRRRLTAAFATARALQTMSLWIDIAVAVVALALMAVLSWRIIRRAVTSLHACAMGIERLARGEFSQPITVMSGDEFGDLAREANRTAGRLREYREQSDREGWIKTGLAGLADHIVGELDPVTLGGKAMRYLATYVGARGAAVYAGGDGERLARLDAVGLDSEPALVDELRREEVAVVRELEVYGDPEASAVVIVPLVHETSVMGALRLALARPTSERTLDLLARIRGVIGTALRVAEAHQRAQALLVETQRHAAATELANKELEAFSYSVSHDLRAPLRSIDAFSQMLVEDYGEQLPDKAQDYLRRIRGAVHRMAELIDALLQLARVSRAELKRESVDVSALFAAVIGELQRNDGERQVEICIQDAVIAVADPRLLKITLENLVGNAWKFTSKTAAARIELGCYEREGDRVFYVRDNGAGFDMTYADRLFGAFQRLHTDKEFPGTGIGLATVQRIILRHGGRIWVEAAVARGASFQFTLTDTSARDSAA